MRHGHMMLHAIKLALLACCATTTNAALAQSTDPALQGAGITPLFGKINPFYGSIDPQFGKINPFFGKINPFFGKINPFFGDVTSYWGLVNPFVQTTDPALLAFYGKTDPFWGSNNPFLSNNKVNYAGLNDFWSGQFANWQAAMQAWTTAQTPADGAALAGMIQNGTIAPAAAFWDKALGKGSQGTSSAAIISAQLAAVGVRFNADGTIDGTSLLGLTPTQQAVAFLSIYDRLMDYAGTGHIDWWMNAVHWSPALAETEGSVPKGGAAPTIGMLDFVIAQGKNMPKQVTQYGGTVFNDGHGAAVGSLIIGATDGSGVLGVLPAGAANVKVYNPYDDTGTTNWTDVGTGIATLAKSVFLSTKTPVGVLNASLGVPGWTLNPGWNDALANANAHGHNLVIAAGNDGVMQTQNVPWNFDANPSLLIVGSVGADGTISNFSNMPGEACLLPTTSSSSACTEANKLKYRFLVAPGELILVSDGMGGHYRQSGTSLAAPLVSGAIAMLQNRWPWLSNYPDETASIILKSATPLGTNPRADAVYGAGELNIAASQSPLNWNALVYIPSITGMRPVVTANAATWGVIQALGSPLATVSSQIAGGSQSSWDASGLAYTAFEKIGNTYRDFYIPLSSKLVGQTVTTQAGMQGYQSYLSTALRAQAGYFATLDAPAPAGVFARGFERTAAPAGSIGPMQLRLAITPTGQAVGFRANGTGTPFETNATLVGDASAVSFGYGNGASALDAGDSFVFRSDHDLATGGANPVLGLASGGAYLGARTRVAPRLGVSFGMTQRDVWRNPVAFGLVGQGAGSWVDRYAAAAQTVNADYAVSPALVTHVGFTRLNERSALLGVQSLDQADLRGGSTTTAATLGFDARLGRGWTVSGSGTVARTSAAGGQITTDDLTGVAGEMAVSKRRVFGRRDQLRVTASTPLHTVGGALRYSSIGVVDRQTGALGVVSQSFGPRAASLPVVGQVAYGRRIAGGEVSLFGRFERVNQITNGDLLGSMAGMQLQLAF